MPCVPGPVLVRWDRPDRRGGPRDRPCGARPRFSGRRAGPRRGRRAAAPRLPESRQAIRWRLAVPHGDRGTSLAGHVGPRHVRLPAAAAVCDGARSSNDYSSGRRTRARLERRLVSGPPGVRMRSVAHSPVLHRGRRRSPGVAWFPVVCMPHRLRTAKTRRAPKFTANQASCLLRIGYVIPFTTAPLVPCDTPFYRRDVSSRYISAR
ncbi:conserved hypothetical protein [Streptomyces misionensis JCM 4497]